MITEKDLEAFGFKPEKDEQVRKQSKKSFTGYPIGEIRIRLAVEAYQMSIEEPYFWVLEYLKNMWSFPRIIKITDVFSASENSSFFGASQQRLGLQQDRVSNFLATIGKMVKELFQLVRELRILDERLGYYADSYNDNSASRVSAEITLKGIWVDMVEQGAKNPASVYGMAREVQFTTLPDLFFNTHPLKQEDVDKVVDNDRAQFNAKVREVLKRKLRSYLAWKEHTYEELKNRRIFTLKYLRQHYEIIKMYMNWCKPYLKNIERLTMDTSKQDSAELLVAFETSMIEIEILAVKGKQCALVNFNYRTRPEMNYQQEYNRGPIHIGKVEMDFHGYVWSEEQIQNYIKLKNREDFKLLGIVDSSVKVAMDALGDELMRYLEEAGEDMTETGKSPKEAKPIKPEGKQLTSSYKSIKELMSKIKKKKAEKKDDWGNEVESQKAKKDVKKAVFGVYNHFKKHHDMLNW